MPVQLLCSNPACGKTLSVADDDAGRPRHCPHCQTPFAGSTPAASVADTAHTSERSSIPDPLPTSVLRGDQPALPKTIGRFEVREWIGSGAFGRVYRAFDPKLEREVALKVPHPGILDSARSAERFIREAKAGARLLHPHIVPVFDADNDGTHYYIVSAFIKGQTLKDALEAGPWDVRRTALLIKQLAEALAYAHKEGIAHRDVKPSNILIDEQGQPRLMDFGLASLQDAGQRISQEGSAMGTPAYMSPEQAQGIKDKNLGASDQYSLGVVLYEMLCGQLPFSGASGYVVACQIHNAPAPPRRHKPHLSPVLEKICLKTMQKRPELRYADCAALAKELGDWLIAPDGKATLALPMGKLEKSKTMDAVKKRVKSVATVAPVEKAKTDTIPITKTEEPAPEPGGSWLRAGVYVLLTLVLCALPIVGYVYRDVLFTREAWAWWPPQREPEPAPTETPKTAPVKPKPPAPPGVTNAVAASWVVHLQNHEDAAERIKAANALAKLGKSGVTALTEMTRAYEKEPDAKAKSAIQQALRDICREVTGTPLTKKDDLIRSAVGIHAAAVQLEDLKKGSTTEARRAAAEELGKLGRHARFALPEIRSAYKDATSGGERAALVGAMGEICKGVRKLDAELELDKLFIGALTDADAQTRASAAHALSCLEVRTAEMRMALEASLKNDADAEVRRRVVIALVGHGDAAFGSLGTALGDADSGVKGEAAKALMATDDTKRLRIYLPDLLAVCKDPHAETRKTALHLLARLVENQDRVVIPTLLWALDDRVIEIRRLAAFVLSDLGGDDAKPALEVLLEAAVNGQPDVRQRAVAGIRNLGPLAAAAVPDLSSFLRKDQDAKVRQYAALALGGIGKKSEPAIPLLAEKIQDVAENREVRVECALALAKIGAVPGAVDIVPALLEVLGDPKQDWRVRERIVWSLRVHAAKLRDMKGAFDTFTRNLQEPPNVDNRMFRYDNAYMLGMIWQNQAPDAALDVLHEFLMDKTILVYDATATSVGSGVKVVEQGKADGRVMATDALKMIGPARYSKHQKIMQQLRNLADGPKTEVALRQKARELLDLAK